MPKKLEYKSFTFKIDKQATEDGFLTFSGYASTFGNVDSDGDTFLQGSFSASIEKETPKMLLMHNSRSVPVGVWVTLKEDAIGLFVEGKMPLDDDRVKGMIAPQMKVGSLDAMSIGFRNAVFDFDQEHTNSWGDPGKIFKKVDLKEISLVTFPANEQARITAVKHMMEDNDFKAEILKLLKPETKTGLWDTLPKAIEDTTKTGLTVDQCHLVVKGDSKFMPIACKSGDDLKVVQSGIVAARAMLGKGNLEITTGERAEIKEVITKYYELMGLDQPFLEGSKWSLPEIKTLGKSDLEFVIRSGKLSRKSSDHIASVFLAAQEKEIGTHTESDDDMKKLLNSMDETLKTKEA